MAVAQLPRPMKVQNPVLQMFANMWFWMVELPWRAIIYYMPNALLGATSAYATAMFAGHASVYPFPFNIFVGVAFEWVYLGMTALAGYVRKSRWYKPVTALGAGCAMIFATLHAANMYGLIDMLMLMPSPYPVTTKLVLSLIHGVPLALLSTGYAFLVHEYRGQLVEEDSKTQFKCPYDCGHPGFPTVDAMNGHKGRCPRKP